MGLSKNITLTIKDYEIKLDKEIKFYENDTIDLCFSILEYGIEVKDGISINKLMPIQALRSYMLIETPHGIDYAESTKIEDNKIVFNLGTKYSQFVGIGRMQIVVKDSDGCRVTLPEFEFEIKESINMNWDRESFDFLATEDDSIIIDEFGRKIHMSKISDMPESENISEESYAMIIDEEGNKRFKVRAIVDAVEDSLDAKFNAYTDEINGDVEEFKGSVRTNITTLTNENNTFKNQVNTSLANYGSDYNGFKDNVEARLGEHMTDYNRFKDGVEARIEEGESTYDGFVSDVSTVLDSYGSTYNAFKSEVNTANASFRNTLNASNQAFKNEMVDRYDNFIYKIDEDIFEGGRTDYFGETHEKIGERLDLDFDVVHQRINDSGLMEYEGCSITANNTYYGRQKDTVIKGRTLQNLAYNCTYNIYYNGNFADNSTIERGNNFIKVAVNPSAGNLTHGYNYIVLGESNDILFKDRTTYTFILKIDTNITHSISVSLKNGSATSALSNVGGFVNGRAIITTDFSMSLDGIKTHFIYLGVPLMSAGDYINVSDLIILEGDHTQTLPEELPYIEGIESSGDKSKNLIDVSKFNPNDSKITIDGDCIVINEPTVTEATLVDNLNIPLNGNYVFNPIVESGNYTGGNVILHYADGGRSENPVTSQGYKYTMENRILTKITIYAPRGTARIKLFLSEGSDINTPYQEYYDGYKISGKSCGKNLIDLSKITTGYIYSDDGRVIEASNNVLTPYMKIKPNTNYICYSEGKSSMHNYSWYDINKNFIKRHSTASDAISPSNACYLRYHNQYVENGEILDLSNVKIQVSEGTSITEYEPYKESTYSYISNEPLRSLPDGICDSIDLETGVLTRRVSKYVFDGSENWSATGYGGHDTRNTFELTIRIDEVPKDNNILAGYCNRFIYEIVHGLPKENGIRVSRTVYDNSYTKYFVLVSPSTDLIPYRDLTKWKEYLQENNLTVYVKSVIPTTEQLTPQQLKSFDATTHVTSDNKLIPIVSTKIPTDLGAMVNTLSLRNRELEEVNEQQDELIDITMMATDEMYSMLEPLMEAVEPMGLLDCSKMAQMYVAMVRRGIKKIEDVPSRYQEEVREALGIKIEEEEWGEDDGIK